MIKDTEKPIAILTVNDDIAKMSKGERNRLCGWLLKQAEDLSINYKQYGKCRMRLMRTQ